MLANTAAYRVAMVCGPHVQNHIRFAVFALFERFTEKGVRVVMLAQEVVSAPLRRPTATTGAPSPRRAVWGMMVEQGSVFPP